MRERFIATATSARLSSKHHSFTSHKSLGDMSTSYTNMKGPKMLRRFICIWNSVFSGVCKFRDLDRKSFGMHQRMFRDSSNPCGTLVQPGAWPNMAQRRAYILSRREYFWPSRLDLDTMNGLTTFGEVSIAGFSIFLIGTKYFY